jgi:hypothetical protein
MTMLHEDKMALDNALEHYGVKGMKWGVRKDRTSAEKTAARKKKKKILVGAAIVVGAGAAAVVLKGEGRRLAVRKAGQQLSNMQVGSQRDRILYMESNAAMKGVEFLNSSKAKADLWQIDENWSRGFHSGPKAKVDRKTVKSIYGEDTVRAFEKAGFFD